MQFIYRVDCMDFGGWSKEELPGVSLESGICKCSFSLGLHGNPSMVSGMRMVLPMFPFYG